MSLQGSLDTFALSDVLLLLAGTGKSGELHVAGHRDAGSVRPPSLQGRVWFEAGELVGCDVPRASDDEDALFELLRLGAGTFSFGPGNAPAPHAPRDVEPLLAEAQRRLSEWREVEKFVPSMTAWLELAAEPPAAHVAMRGDQWRLIAAVGGGCEVDAVLARLGLGDLAGCRAVKELVEGGLVALTPEAPRAPALVPEPVGAAEPVATADWNRVDAGTWSPDPDEAGVPWLSSLSNGATVGPTGAETVVDVAAAEPTSRPATADTDDPWGPQGWQLEPAGETSALVTFPSAPAPAATPDATEPRPTGETAAEEVEAGEEGDEPLNRGLLLKFLSSVRN